MARGEFDLALSLGQDLLRLSQRNDSAGLVLGHTCCGLNLMLAGKFAASRSHLEAGLALYDPISHRSLVHQAGIHPRVISQAYLGITLFCLGSPGQALARSNAAIAEALRLAHPPSLAQSLAMDARLLSLVGENAAAALDERAAQLVAVTTEQGFAFWRAQGMILRGWVKVKNGDVAEGISLLRRGSSAYRPTGAEVWRPYQIALLARACEIAGQLEEALTLLHDALEIAERTGERWFAAELNRHKGQLLLRQGHSEAAEELFKREGISFKKSLYASEQDRADIARRRVRWKQYQGRLDPKRLVFIDETWAKTNMTRRHGRSPRGIRLIAKVPHGRWRTLTFLAALRCDRIAAPCVIDGPINGTSFRA